MSSRLLRRVLPIFVVGAAVAASSLIAVESASAGPISAPYTCGAKALNGTKLKIKFNLDTTAPSRMYVGQSTSPTLIVKATIPRNVVGLAAFFGVKSASAIGTFGVVINGTLRKRPLVFPRTDIPQTPTDFPVTIMVPLPAATRSTVGVVTYKPGPVAVTLYGYKNKTADGGASFGNVTASCTSDAPKKVIDSIAFVKSATAVSTTAAYSKVTKKLSETATVTAASGSVPAGFVTATLYKGQSKVASKKIALINGVASAAFGALKPGSYKLVTTYAGTKALKASSKVNTFTIK
jgi:hypothetical protein